MIAAISAGRRIAVAFGCLVLVATSASAECAWVIWSYHETIFRKTSAPGPAPEWRIGQIADTRSECEKILEDDIQRELRTPTPATLGNWATVVTGQLARTVISTEKEKGIETRTSYRCLPVGLDPRPRPKE